MEMYINPYTAERRDVFGNTSLKAQEIFQGLGGGGRGGGVKPVGRKSQVLPKAS